MKKMLREPEPPPEPKVATLAAYVNPVLMSVASHTVPYCPSPRRLPSVYLPHPATAAPRQRPLDPPQDHDQTAGSMQTRRNSLGADERPLTAAASVHRLDRRWSRFFGRGFPRFHLENPHILIYFDRKKKFDQSCNMNSSECTSFCSVLQDPRNPLQRSERTQGFAADPVYGRAKCLPMLGEIKT